MGDQPTGPPPPRLPPRSRSSPRPRTWLRSATRPGLRQKCGTGTATRCLGAAVTWSSGAATVVTVDATGQLTAAGNGTARVTASAGPAVRSAAVTVQPAPAAVSLVPDSQGLKPAGDTVTLMAVVVGANGYQTDGVQLRWASRGRHGRPRDRGSHGVDGGHRESDWPRGQRRGDHRILCRLESLGRIELSFTALGDTATLTATAVDRRGARGGTVEFVPVGILAAEPPAQGVGEHLAREGAGRGEVGAVTRDADEDHGRREGSLARGATVGEFLEAMAGGMTEGGGQMAAGPGAEDAG